MFSISGFTPSTGLSRHVTYIVMMSGQNLVELFQTVRTRPFGAVPTCRAPDTLDIEVLRDLREVFVQRANDDLRSAQPPRHSDQRCEREENDADDAENKDCELPVIEERQTVSNGRHKKTAF